MKNNNRKPRILYFDASPFFGGSAAMVYAMIKNIDPETSLEIDTHWPFQTKRLKRLHPAAWWEVLEELLHAVGERRGPFYINRPVAGLKFMQN